MIEITTLVQRRLAGHQRHVIEEAGHRRAAVLVPLYGEGQEAFVLFTKRTETVEHHKGQISFPGGAVDLRDADLLATALRETNEELGISPEQVRVLGALDDVQALVSGFVITPFVGVIPHPYPFIASPDEISEILIIPLRVFRDPHSLRVEGVQHAGEQVNRYFYRFGDHEIWGVTARIMKGMVDLVFAGEPT